MNQYVIPANFTDAGRLFGIFELRNGIEATALSVPLLMLCLSWLPFSLTTNLIVTMVLVIPVGGFAHMVSMAAETRRYLPSWEQTHEEKEGETIL